MEILALIVGCVCHDLDHRGTNNAFQAKWDSVTATQPLVQYKSGIFITWSWMLDFFTLHMNRMTFVFLRTGSALSLLYGTSATLEHHHFNHAVMILQSEVNLQAPWNPKFSIFVECSSVYYKWLSGHIHTYLIIWTKLSHIQHIFSHSRSRFSQYTQQLRRIDGLHFGFKQLTMNYLNYSTKLQILENLSRN